MIVGYFVVSRGWMFCGNRKVIEKGHIVKDGKIQSFLNEKKILAASTFPFISNLVYHFKDNARVYMFFQVQSKTDEFFSNLVRFETCSEKTCRFYAAQLVLLLEYLHCVGIIYRDLCPENVMVDGRGYIRIR